MGNNYASQRVSIENGSDETILGSKNLVLVGGNENVFVPNNNGDFTGSGDEYNWAGSERKVSGDKHFGKTIGREILTKKFDLNNDVSLTQKMMNTNLFYDSISKKTQQRLDKKLQSVRQQNMKHDQDEMVVGLSNLHDEMFDIRPIIKLDEVEQGMEGDLQVKLKNVHVMLDKLKNEKNNPLLPESIVELNEKISTHLQEKMAASDEYNHDERIAAEIVDDIKCDLMRYNRNGDDVVLLENETMGGFKPSFSDVNQFVEVEYKKVSNTLKELMSNKTTTNTNPVFIKNYSPSLNS